MKRGGRGFKMAGGASFCHFCSNQLTFAKPGAFCFDTVLTPGDRLPVRVHKQCKDKAVKEGYRAPPP